MKYCNKLREAHGQVKVYIVVFLRATNCAINQIKLSDGDVPKTNFRKGCFMDENKQREFFGDFFRHK